MRKLFKRRPSAGAVIGFVALCVALGGGAYAANSKKVDYKGRSPEGPGSQPNERADGHDAL